MTSRGNGNQLLIWNQRSQQSVLKFTEHTAAVKAIVWSLHQLCLFASGGDEILRFLNVFPAVKSKVIVQDFGAWSMGRSHIRLAERLFLVQRNSNMHVNLGSLVRGFTETAYIACKSYHVSPTQPFSTY
ncbi:Protein FIZZY-RELATED 3 [Dendrobium catenatum]|uniref:Protein FIZZY-RELATED 3 n=1 Tax=Dendrobium catenatum TaxID=906689 RepID=A0A2I0W317_9ASPA|nr:Protein FIZZY-RELATED 3 [Dendrobium catenatum]